VLLRPDRPSRPHSPKTAAILGPLTATHYKISAVQDSMAKQQQNLTLKGQSSEAILWVKCKNLLVIGPLLGVPNIFEFGLVFAEIFVFENRLNGIVYYGESKLPVSFTAESQNSLRCLLCRVMTSCVLCWAESS